MEVLNLLIGFVWSEMLFPMYPIVLPIGKTILEMAPVVLIASVLQACFPAVKRRPKILSYEMWLDVLYLLFPNFLYMTAIGTAALSGGEWLAMSVPPPLEWVRELPYPLQVFIAVWLFDLVVYWRHRLSHEIGVLWPIHAIHHTSHQVDVLTTTRLHFLEVLAGAMIMRWLASFSGLDVNALGLGLVIYGSWNMFIHTNVRIKFPGFLKYVFNSPFMHRWHHAVEKEAVNKNYGVVFAWNDWLFRTAIHPSDEPAAYGIEYPEGETAAESFLAHQLYPFRIWLRRLISLPRRRPTPAPLPTDTIVDP